MRELRCQETGCTSRDAGPQFTNSLASIGEKKWTRQPKWFCKVHAKKHPSVSALTGLPRRQTPVKSYEIVEGQLKPLPVNERYGMNGQREVKLHVVR